MTRSQKPLSIFSITLYCLYACVMRGVQVVFCLGILVLVLSGHSLTGPGESMFRHPATSQGGASQDSPDTSANVLPHTAGTVLESRALPGHVPGHV